MSEDEQTEDRSPLGQMKATIAASFGRDSRQYLREQLDRAFALGADAQAVRLAVLRGAAMRLQKSTEFLAFTENTPREPGVSLSEAIREREAADAALRAAIADSPAERRSVVEGAAFDAVAGAVGLDAFGGANPREVYLRVTRKLKEHERMRAALARIHDDNADLSRLLCDVEGEVARD